jgi:nucleoside-diphosphate-sugar epimerase
MHTILGAGGPAANALTNELLHNNAEIRLVSRRESKFKHQNISWKKADLLNYPEVLAAVKGSGVIYLCAGLVYDADIWEQQWPVIMGNVINAAKETQTRLIFFDNVYMYGLVEGPMTEDTPYNPNSRKGEVRAKVATQLMEEAKAGNISASIARAADFYGTDSMNSFLDMMVLSPYSKKQKATWMGKPDTLHSFTFIPDTGKAMYLLGQDPAADNQIWHLPTATSMTGKEFINLAAQIYDTAPKYMAVNKTMLWMLGLFKKVVAGTVEMYYQYNHDYIFDSSKIEKAYGISPSTYADGIKLMSETLYRKQ